MFLYHQPPLSVTTAGITNDQHFISYPWNLSANVRKCFVKCINKLFSRIWFVIDQRKYSITHFYSIPSLLISRYVLTWMEEALCNLFLSSLWKSVCGSPSSLFSSNIYFPMGERQFTARSIINFRGLVSKSGLALTFFRKSTLHFFTKTWIDNNPDSAHTVPLGVCSLTQEAPWWMPCMLCMLPRSSPTNSHMYTQLHWT